MIEENKKPAGTKYLIEVESKKDVDIISSSIGRSLYQHENSNHVFEDEFKVSTIYLVTYDQLKEDMITKISEAIRAIH